MATKYVRHDADGSGDGTTTASTGATGAWTFAQMLAATPAAGDEIRIMATGTYSRSAAGSINYANGTAAANIKITGANASGTVDGTRPTIQASAGGITLLQINSSHIYLDYLIVDGNSQASVHGIDLAANYTRCRRSKAMGTTLTGLRLNAANNCYAEQIEVTGCSGLAGIELAGAGSRARFCYSHDNTIHGFRSNGASGSFEFCISESNSGAGTDGFNNNSVGYGATNCIAYNNGRDGFNLDGNAGFGTYLTNCIAYGNASEGFGSDGVKSGAFLLNCAGGNNTSGNYNGTNLVNVESLQALTGDPFTNAAAGDFSLNNTASAGAACRAAGFPGAYPAGLTTGYLDIGAAQHQDAGGGGGSRGRIIGG